MSARRVEASEGLLGAWVFGATASLVDLCVVRACVGGLGDIEAHRSAWFRNRQTQLETLRRAEQVAGRFSDAVMVDRIDRAFRPIEDDWGAADLVLALSVSTHGYVTASIDLDDEDAVGRATDVGLAVVGADLFDALTIAGIERRDDLEAVSADVVLAMSAAAALVGDHRRLGSEAWRAWRVARLPFYVRPDSAAVPEVGERIRAIDARYAAAYDPASGDN